MRERKELFALWQGDVLYCLHDDHLDHAHHAVKVFGQDLNGESAREDAGFACRVVPRKPVQQEPREVLHPVVSAIGLASQGCTVDIVLSMDDFSLEQTLKEKIVIVDAPVTGQHQQQGETSRDLVENFVGEFRVRELVQQEPLVILDPVVPAISSTSHVCDVNIVTFVDDFPRMELGGGHCDRGIHGDRAAATAGRDRQGYGRSLREAESLYLQSSAGTDALPPE
jgi:hypothetical protein